MEKPSFGAHESPWDDKRVTSDMLASPQLIASSWKIVLDMPSTDLLCDQRKLGICTECGTRMGSEHWFFDGERLSEYWGYLINKVLVEGNLMEGSALLFSLKAAHTYGIPSKAIEDAFPLATGDSYDDFISDFESKYHGKIPQAVLDDAARHRIPGYYQLSAITPLSIAKEITKGKVLMCRFSVGENTYTAPDGRISWDAKDLLPLRAPKNIEGGHIMCISEYHGTTMGQVLRGPNSWSDRWGDKGYFTMAFSTQQPYFTEAWGIAALPFLNDLGAGTDHPDVRRLQHWLNCNGFPVAEAGPGSAGHETEHYGPLTAQAVANYQKASGISPAVGFTGPKTRASINASF